MVGFQDQLKAAARFAKDAKLLMDALERESRAIQNVREPWRDEPEDGLEHIMDSVERGRISVDRDDWLEKRDLIQGQRHWSAAVTAFALCEAVAIAILGWQMCHHVCPLATLPATQTLAATGLKRLEVGDGGQILVSGSSGAPKWVELKTLTVKE